jgi:hypothetical protein
VYTFLNFFGDHERIPDLPRYDIPLMEPLCAFKAAVNFSKQDKGASLSERMRVLAPPVLGNSQGQPQAFKVRKKFFAYFLTQESRSPQKAKASFQILKLSSKGRDIPT